MQPRDYILAVECSTIFGSVAVCRSLEVLSSVSWKRKKSHAKCLLPSISQALSLANLDFHQIDMLAVGNGPGSFTGIRVALSAVRTLAYALNLPVAVFNSLRILAANHQMVKSKDTVYTVQNAFSQKFYFAQYVKTSQKCIEKKPPQVILKEQLQDMLQKPGRVLGDIHELLPEQLRTSSHLDIPHKDEVIHYPQAAQLGLLPAKEASTFSVCQWEDVTPLYLRASSAEEKIK